MRRIVLEEPNADKEVIAKYDRLSLKIEMFRLWNEKLFGRFVRKSLSFSKSEAMHEVCLRLFLHDYNRLLRCITT